MGYKQLYIWVEGPDDTRFFDGIKRQVFRERASFVQTVEYSQMRPAKVKDFLRSIKAQGADYFFIGDINSAPCVTAKKEQIQVKYEIDDVSKILVVIREIESWYLAGLDTEASRKLRSSALDNTDDVTKERFNSLIPKRFDSRVDFMLEVLQHFSLETAQQKNISFKYFIQKHNLGV